jgi:hypothetical protein
VDDANVGSRMRLENPIADRGADALERFRTLGPMKRA